MAPPLQLEFRVHTLLEAVAAGRSLAEVDPWASSFRGWPGPPRSAARRLAAHANAARGREVLWLIPGTEVARFQEWLGKVAPFFDGLAPRVTAFNVPTGGKDARGRVRQVIALQVETARAPFVVRHGNACEVPWLEANGTDIRAAGRLELIKLLSPLEDLPQFEVLEAELTFYKNPHVGLASKAAYRWTLDGSLYVIPRADGRLVIPLHRCRCSVSLSEGRLTSEATDLSLTADKNSTAIRITESAALIEGLGRFFVYACGSTTQADLPTQAPVNVLLDLVPAGSDRAAIATALLRPEAVTESNQAGRWKL